MLGGLRKRAVRGELGGELVLQRLTASEMQMRDGASHRCGMAAAGVRAAIPLLGARRQASANQQPPLRVLAMAQVQAPLPADAVPRAAQSSGVDKDALVTRLDALLEQYLLTLDQYEQLTQQLSKQLSSVRTTPNPLRWHR